ncbi:MAG: hypothetical protein P8Z35_13635 [Ignavibacteriaceae bacterium]
MSMKINESYNAVVIELKGKLIGGPLSSEYLNNLIQQRKLLKAITNKFKTEKTISYSFKRIKRIL